MLARERSRAAFSVGLAVAVIGAACGRTDLPFAGLDEGIIDGGPADARPDAPEDFPDAVVDAAPDVVVDADLPDVEPPPPDAPLDCEVVVDGILLLSGESGLYLFDPDTVEATWLANVACGASLNTMAVDRNGVPYVASQSGELFQVERESGACAQLPFDTSQLTGQKYGMGFVADDVPRGERLFIMEQDSVEVIMLSTIDIETLELEQIAPFARPLPPTEITGTADGRMFGFHVADANQPARLLRIDKKTADATLVASIPIGFPYSAFHFAVWRGDVYIFITLQGESDAGVLRYRPDDGTVEEIGRIPPRVIGAGVSACAPI